MLLPAMCQGPTGRLFQVEYAMQAVEQGTPVPHLPPCCTQAPDHPIIILHDFEFLLSLAK